MISTPYEQAAEALADALMPDPFYRAITMGRLGESRTRRDCLAQYFLYALQEGERYGVVVLPSPEADGAAIWLYPQDQDVQQALAKEKDQFLESLLSKTGYANYKAIIDFMHPRAQQVVPAASWYLSILGVSPRVQGRGLGQHLLRLTLEQADHGGVDCYLETFTERNIRFYSKLGFVEAVTFLEPTTQSQYWIMVREPRNLIDRGRPGHPATI